jgi:predicted transcriptional regulator
LTNLYNERPAWLDNVHRELETAVAAAYGWPADISEEDALARLLDLNRERAAAGRGRGCHLRRFVVQCKHCEQTASHMSKSVTIAARIDAHLDIEIERLASATGRSKSWLINEALRFYVANEQQFLAAIEEGKQALRDGKVVDHATVVEAFERIVKPHP